MFSDSRVFVTAILGVVAVCCSCQQETPVKEKVATSEVSRTYSSFDLHRDNEETFPSGMISFENASLEMALEVYGQLSKRSIIRAADVPDCEIDFVSQTPMRRAEVLQALDTVLAAQDVVMVYMGERYVKAVRRDKANLESPPVVDLRAEQLPESSSYLTYFVEVRNIPVRKAADALQPLAAMPNGILAVTAGETPGGLSQLAASKLGGGLFPPKDHGLLILRDFSSNVRRMLELLAKLEEQ